MKQILKCLLLCACASLLSGCVKVTHGGIDIAQHDDNATEHFVLRQVLQMDPLNPTGIDIYPYFKEFASLSLSLYFENGKIAYAEFDNGELPYNPLPFSFPSGKIACTYDNSCIPPVLRLSTGEVLAQMIQNEPVIAFSLDYNKISYKYTFKTVKE